MRRSLTAVLSADVAGYSAMMGADAEGTLATLRRLRSEILGPAVAAGRGRVIKSMGDGWIATFGAVSGAVECAMKVQDRLKVDGAMALRIGVHLGDVAEADEDVFGEGVNVAARLQSIAEPGAVAISDAAYSLLDGTLRPSFDAAGERRLKNIALPMQVWSRGGEVAGGAAALTVGGFPHLSIRPVATTDPRADVVELAEALTGDLATYLDSLRWLTARVSEKPEPGAFRLEATLRARGDRLRLEGRLTAPDGAQVGAQKIDGDLGDVFDWQDSAGMEMATGAMNALISNQTAVIEATPAADRTAEQLLMTAWSRIEGGGDAKLLALAQLDEAIRLKPDFGYAYALALALLSVSESSGLGDALKSYTAKRAHWIERLDALEPVNSPSRVMLAYGRMTSTDEREAVRADIARLMRNLPFDPELLLWAGFLHLYFGQAQDALACFARAESGLMLSNLFSAIPAGKALACCQLDRNEEALALAEDAIGRNPVNTAGHRAKACACGRLGHLDDARAALAALEKISPGERVSAMRENSGYLLTPETEQYFDGLALAGMPE